MPKTWEECGRDDLNMIPKMQAAGWSPNICKNDERAGRIKPENPPMDLVSFIKGRTHVWMAFTFRTNDSRWIAADLKEGSYVDHRDYESLDEVLLKEKGVAL